MSSSDRPLRRTFSLFRGFTAATAFFTRIPIEPSSRAAWQIADAAWAFPLVGAGIGAVVALAFFAAQLAGLGTWPAALITVLAGLILTGALHEDGLADTADGLCGGADREAKLAIMRDSRNGTFGVLALIASVGLRAAAVAQLGDLIHVGLALVAAHAASRATLPAAMRLLFPARTDGLGAMAGRPSAPAVIVSAAIGLGIALSALGPVRGAAALGLTGAAVFGAAMLARRQIGGYTGDVLGALQQIGEIVMLLAASAK